MPRPRTRGLRYEEDLVWARLFATYQYTVCRTREMEQERGYKEGKTYSTTTSTALSTSSIRSTTWASSVHDCVYFGGLVVKVEFVELDFAFAFALVS